MVKLAGLVNHYAFLKIFFVILYAFSYWIILSANTIYYKVANVFSDFIFMYFNTGKLKTFMWLNLSVCDVCY